MEKERLRRIFQRDTKSSLNVLQQYPQSARAQHEDRENLTGECEFSSSQVTQLAESQAIKDREEKEKFSQAADCCLEFGKFC
jgi:hypothetical protein